MLGTLTNEEIDNLLYEQNIGRLACYADEKIYLVPITYIYDNGFIVGHTNAGTKVNMMRKNPNVCFETDDVKDIFNWKSVIIRGIYEELQGDEATIAFKRLYERIGPLMQRSEEHPHVQDETIHRRDISLDSAIVYRIRITEKTGRFEKR
jgi:nitroimidazol reductase NimA-like FMN-containing flavoprotein (pyridoxamine 5'-phosphate oxidase superfamily)